MPGVASGEIRRFFIPGLPADAAPGVAKAMQRPVGTVTFFASYPGLLARDGRTGVLFEVVVGRVLFRLTRNEDFSLRFAHATPGKGTHEASLDLAALGEPQTDRFFVGLVWSPTATRLTVGQVGGDELVAAEGRPASYTLQIAPTGTILQVGGSGVEVMGARMYHGGIETSAPSAIDTWEDTRLAALTLLSEESNQGQLFEVVAANAALGMLVTGFESYTSARFAELEDEGIPLDFKSLATAVLSQEERAKLAEGQETTLEATARESGVAISSLLAERINFQSYSKAKTAFNRGYGLRFGDLASTTSQHLEELQRWIRYRHRVVHISPLLGLLNGPESPPEAPLFAGRAAMTDAIELFDSFIRDLHDATLALDSGP